MKNVKNSLLSAGLFAWVLLAATSNTLAQVTPSADAYTNSASAGTNFGTAVTLGTVTSATSIQKSYIQFDLSSIPAGFNGSNIAKATLKLYVNSVTTAGSFNVDYVTGPWAEKTITGNLSPSLGTTVVGSVPLTTALVHDYLLVDVTPAVVAWLNGTQANDGLALVANSPLNATFDSKENITNSHAPELDIVFTGGLSGATLTTGGGLAGGVSGGVLNVGLLRTCSTKQVLQWNGTAWACSSAGAGTVSSVGLSAPVSDFTVTGSPVTSTGTLGLNWTVPPSSASTANAIVKRDATGSFNVNNINGTGTISVITANPNAVFGGTSLDGGFGVYGSAQVITGTQISTGVLGDNISPGKLSSGVLGLDNNTTTSATTGVQGSSQSPVGIGVLGYGATLSNTANSNIGSARAGIWGDSPTAIGVLATTDSGFAIEALGKTGGGIRVVTDGPNTAIEAQTLSASAFLGGNRDTLNPTLSLENTTTATNGLLFFAQAPLALTGDCEITTSSDLACTGKLIGAQKLFKIDHPLDPANKYLLHTSIESPDRMNIYNGIALLDAKGEALVEMPSYFEALNGDFRYQLTCIGGFVPVYVAQEISNNQFRIAGGKPGIKVSWQVTGIRHDAWAKANPSEVEVEKVGDERGHYLHPEAFGQPKEMGVSTVRAARQHAMRPPGVATRLAAVQGSEAAK